MTSGEIRQQFIEFFTERGHRFVASGSVVPADDPTLLFTNAGMNQFKDIFLGVKSRDYNRAANSQKCIRVSGKHNDLEEVGRDTYHHTFFEMLGNWSFGDYFKREAIAWAWELLTDVYGIDPACLYATVFGGDKTCGLEPDTDAEKLWTEVTPIAADRVLRFGHKDNFWEMGETGPCGPCSEIHIDLGPDRCDKQHVAGHRCAVNGGCARFVELWNLVFIQFDRRSETELVALPARHVDTGAGLERICAVLQGKRSNYDTDLFTPIIAAAEKLCGKSYTGKLGKGAEADNAFRVVADHVRMLCFSIADGSTPSNDGRGYVQRRILRRAVRFGRQHLDLHEPFLFKLVPVVGQVMGKAFNEVVAAADRIASVIREEEESFGRTLDRGIRLFEEASARAAGGQVSGRDAFKLYETYGFPIDLTQLMAEERGQRVDMAEFDRLMAEHQAISSAGTKKKIEVLVGGEPTDDRAKYGDQPTAAKIVGFQRGDRLVGDDATAGPADGETGVVLDATGFYAEQGGQVGDTGRIVTDTGAFAVSDTVRVGATVIHLGRVERGELRAGQPARCEIGRARRDDIRRNHTATHLLHWALHEALGEHVQQAGSLVAPDRLRFDFNHAGALTADQIERVEQLVNERVLADEPVTTRELPIEQARELPGVRAFFGEKYEDVVRVVEIGGEATFSREFCGGTHLDRTGRIGLFKITAEESVAKGVRRISAVTGAAAVELVQQMGRRQAAAAALLKAPPDQLVERIEALQNEVRELKKARSGKAASAVDEALGKILASAEELDGGAKLCVGELPEASADQMRAGVDWLRSKAPSVAALLASCGEGKVSLVAGVTDDLVARGGHAGKWVGQVAALVGGKGGGRPQMAQAGGKEPEKLPEALAAAAAAFQAMIG